MQQDRGCRPRQPGGQDQRGCRSLQNSGVSLVSTTIPRTLIDVAEGLAAAKSLVLISGLQLLLLAAAALALAGRLLASHRDEENALLAARGAARWQLVRPSLAEGVVACAVAAAVGTIAGVRLAALLLSRLTGSELHAAVPGADAWLGGGARAGLLPRHRAVARAAAARRWRRQDPPGTAGRRSLGCCRRCRPRLDRARDRVRTRTAQLLGGGRRSWPRSGHRRRAGARARRPRPDTAASASPRREGPGETDGARQAAGLGDGELGNQQAPGPAERPGATGDTGRWHQHAGARAVRELAAIGTRSGCLRSRRAGPGRTGQCRADVRSGADHPAARCYGCHAGQPAVDRDRAVAGDWRPTGGGYSHDAF